MTGVLYILVESDYKILDTSLQSHSSNSRSSSVKGSTV